MNKRILLLAAALAAGASSSLIAQSVVIREGSRVSTQVAPGTKVVVPVIVDLTNGSGTNFASLSTNVAWDPSRLAFDSITAGFGTLTANTATATDGTLAFSVFDPVGTTATQTVANMYFTALSGVGGTRVQIQPTVIGDAAGGDIGPLLRLQHLDVCVANGGLFGDANGDATVNIIDAQQIARFSVGLTVANVTLLQMQSDVNADNSINIIDAQQIARFSVGLTASARVNTASALPPPVASMAGSNATATIYAGTSIQVQATPLDASSNSLVGCYPTTYTSNAPAVATADSTGRLTGVSSGTAVITATTQGFTVTGTLTVLTAGPPATITAVAGNQQFTYNGLAVATTPQVLVRDAFAVPVPNVPVTFTANGGSFNGGQPLVVRTNANGAASAPGWIPPSTGTSVSMTAAVAGISTPITITANLVGSGIGQSSCIKDAWGLRCWGNGTRGQLGNGALNSSTTPVDVTGGSALASVTGGTSGDHFCGLDSGGAALCWGWNAAGQLGDGTTTDRSTPTPVSGGLVFTSIATGVAHTCAVSSGDVYCWGIGPFGQLGDSTRGSRYLTPTKVKSPSGVTFTQVTAGTNFTCAIATGGDAYCWGLATAGQLGDGAVGTVISRNTPTLVIGGIKFSKIASSLNHTCALDLAGAAYCWGLNTGTVIGTSVGALIGSPAPITGGHVFTDISTGLGRACGIKAAPDNSTWCWGSNFGGLGDGGNTDRSTPTLLPVTFRKVFQGGFSGLGHACGISVGGEQTFCWGLNNSGQLGDGTTTARSAPTLVQRGGTTPGAPLSIEAQTVFMTTQSASNGTAVPIAPSVVVRDGTGALVSGVTVNWTVLSGGGAVTNSTSITDAGGIATSGGWTLGGTAGLQTLQATVNGVIVNGGAASSPLRQTFAGFGTNTPAFAVKILGDTNYVTGTNASVALIPLAVRVTDASNNPLPNVAVTFSLGANSGTFLNSNSTIAVSTDASGVATLTGQPWSPNNSLNAVSTVLATVAGIATPAVFTAIRANQNFGIAACELTNAGAAMCAGVNTFGTVGDGTTTNRSTFVPVSGGLVFSSLAEGWSTTKCGLVGTQAFCWGNNSMGQIGDGTQVNRSVPIAVGGSLAFSQLVTGGNATCGLTTTQQLFCWGWTGSAGWNEGGALRGRVHLVPTLVNTAGITFTKVTLSDDGICGLSTTGSIQCLSNGTINGDGNTSVATSWTTWAGGPYIDVSAGNTIACALDTNGLAFCVGSNQGNAQGNGSNATNFLPTQVIGGVSFTDIHVGNFRACARRSNSDVYCWGLNSGTGVGQVDRPTQIPGFKATQLRAQTFRNNCAKALSGLLYCWGAGTSGLGINGDGTTIDRLSPVAALNWPDGPAAGVAATVALNSTFATQFAGATVSPTPAVTVRDRLGNPVAGVTVTFTPAAGSGTVTGGSVITNSSGVATVGAWTLSSNVGTARLDISAPGVPPAVLILTVVTAPGSIAINSGNNQFVPDFYTGPQTIGVQVLDQLNAPINAATVTWSTSFGTLSQTTSTTATTGIATLPGVSWTMPSSNATAYTLQASVVGLPAASITARRISYFSNGFILNPSICRINVSNSAFCWGGNLNGTIGDGTNTNRSAPTAVTAPPALTTLADNAFANHQCGLTAGGQAFCWGRNDMGQLGDGTQVNRNAPVAVTGGLTFTKLSVGALTTCGIATNGATFCWGWLSFSFLGDGQFYQFVTAPTAVNTGGRTFVSLAVGGRTICGLDASGQAFCWGDGFSGNLGAGTTASSFVALPTITSLRFTQLTAGYEFTCGTTTTGQVACWGNSTSGQTGTGSTANVLSPTVLSGISGAVEVRATEASACARTASALFCWGNNPSGQVGDGTLTTRLSPVQVASGITPTALGSFTRSSACVATARNLYCWGTTSSGIGDGTTSQRSLPTAVQWVDASPANEASIFGVTSTSFSAAAGTPQTVTVQVRNIFGAPIANKTVSFVVTQGGGNVTIASGTSDTSGNVTTSWTLAGASGTVNKLEARVTDLPSLVITGTIP